MSSRFKTIGSWAFALLACGRVLHADVIMAYDLRVAQESLPPGQPQTIEVWCEFLPLKGQPLCPETPGSPIVVGFSLARFDILNTANAQSGTYGSFISLLPVVVQPQLSPTNALLGTFVDNLDPGLPFFDFHNPIRLGFISWFPHPGSPRQVSIETASMPEYSAAILVTQDGFTFTSAAADVVKHDAVSWTVLPAPTSFGLLAAAACVARRRRAITTRR